MIRGLIVLGVLMLVYSLPIGISGPCDVYRTHGQSTLTRTKTTWMLKTIIEGAVHAQLGLVMRYQISYEAQDTPAGRLWCEQKQEKLDRYIILFWLEFVGLPYD